MTLPLGRLDRRISSLETAYQELSDLSYNSYVRLFDTAAENLGMTSEDLSGGLRLYSLGYGHPSALIISGQHGDERAGPIALLDLIQSGELYPSVSVRVCPIVNPDAWDMQVRKLGGLNVNRVWGTNSAPPEIDDLMLVIEQDPPDIFLDLHESNEPLPESGEMHELRHAGTPWGHALIDALGAGVAGVKLHTHIPGSAEKYAHDLGVLGTAAVETNTYMPLSDRVEFHKQVLRVALDL